MELSGRLSSFPIAELLHWAHNDRRTGSLTVRRAGREKRIYFREGRILACLTDEPSEFYGQFLLLSGYLDRDTLYRCVSICREKGKRLGRVLQEEKLLDLADIQRTLRYHIEDVICDIFLWDHGVFAFRAEQPSQEELLAEPIAPTQLTLEGSHWIDQMGRIRQVLPDDYVILGLKEDAPVGKLASELTPRKLRILDEVDGIRRLEALYGAIHGSWYRFLCAVFELHQDGHLEIVRHGRSFHAPRRDIGLDDLLMEQASREQALQRHSSADLGNFERFVPIWVCPPSEEEWERMPESARTLFRGFDGQSRLSELLSEDEDAWNRELELLMLQIGKEAVALLPCRLDELEKRADSEEITARRRWWRRLTAESRGDEP